jgi:DNA-binding transcriptional LysR family regulator
MKLSQSRDVIALSEQALTRSVRELEHELEASLFERGPSARMWRPSAGGRRGREAMRRKR